MNSKSATRTDAFGGHLMVLAVLALLAVASPASAEGHGGGAERRTTISFTVAGRYFYDAPRFQHVGMRELVEATIVDVLEKKGFRFLDTPDTGDLLLTYIIALEGEADAAAREDAALHDPLLAPIVRQGQVLEQGIASVKISDASNRATVWSNSGRGLVALDLPEQIRTKRVRESVEALFESFPATATWTGHAPGDASAER